MRIIDSVVPLVSNMLRQSQDYIHCANNLKYLLLSALPKPYLHRLLYPSAALVLVLPSPSFFLIAPPSFLPSFLVCIVRRSPFDISRKLLVSRASLGCGHRDRHERENPHTKMKKMKIFALLFSRLSNFSRESYSLISHCYPSGKTIDSFVFKSV